MLQHTPQSTTNPTPPARASFPNVPRVAEAADLRIRQLARAMHKLGPGVTDTVLVAEGFSLHEQRIYGDAARQIANHRFVRHDEVPAYERPSDAMLTAEAIALFDPGFDALLIKLRARPDFDEDTLARIWPQVMTGAAARLATSRLPRPLAEREVA